MEAFLGLLLRIWREACRHIEVEESATRIASILAEEIPFDWLLMYRVDPERARVERVCFVTLKRHVDEPPLPTLAKAQARTLGNWCRQGRPLRFGASSVAVALAPLVPQGFGNDFLAGPLCSEHDTLGVLLMVSAEAGAFTERHMRLVRELQEPFSVALENERRLEELVALREAAEADKHSLLARLGRDTLHTEIVGAEAGLRSVMERVKLVARSEAPVLILGETGSGKEVVARAIHENSPRSAGPFIRVNCAAIPAELIDSELFGHERGSFTGAVATRRGWFERAHEGTLFLDEIGELSLAAQVRFLRVLQEGSFERVGGEETQHVNVRTVAATHQDLARMVQEHRFREDLWYRIAVFPIVLPPLRERNEDIPALAEHFARRASRRFGLRLQLPSADEIRVLSEYDWPGNVRELASVIDRAVILGDGERIDVAKALGISPTSTRGPVTPLAAESAREYKVAQTIDEAMRAHIERALIASRGKIEGRGGAAAALEINPHTLRARMRKLGIDWRRFRE